MMMASIPDGKSDVFLRLSFARDGMSVSFSSVPFIKRKNYNSL